MGEGGRREGLTPACPLHVLCTDLAPGIDEIYEESQQVFLAPGHPQDGQVVFYKVRGHRPAPQVQARPAPPPCSKPMCSCRSAWTVA